MQNSVNVEYLCLIQLELQTDLVLTSIDKREITTRDIGPTTGICFNAIPPY